MLQGIWMALSEKIDEPRTLVMDLEVRAVRWPGAIWLRQVRCVGQSTCLGGRLKSRYDVLGARHSHPQ